MQPSTPDLYQYYEVVYVKADNWATAQAWFSTTPNGNAVVFGDRSNITANGKPGENSKKESPYHEWTNNVLDFTFNLKKPGNVVVTNNVSMSSIGDVDLVIDSVLNLSDTVHVSWKGAPKLTDEFIGISLQRVTDSSSDQLSEMSAAFTGTNLTLDFAETSKLLPGTYNAYAIRNRNIPLQQRDGNAGGEIKVRFIDRKTIAIK